MRVNSENGYFMKSILLVGLRIKKNKNTITSKKVLTFDESDVWAALIIASLLVRLNGIAIESNTFIASPAARWNASEMRVGWDP